MSVQDLDSGMAGLNVPHALPPEGGDPDLDARMADLNVPAAATQFLKANPALSGSIL